MGEFTGNPDVDRRILLTLPDAELARACQANRYLAQLCTQESFWQARY
jgi:hypothetical protein